MDIELLDQETEDISSSGNLLLQLVGAKLTSERPNTQRELQSELSLGLSLGGCFAVEPREMRLVRSSSNATIFAETPIGASVPLARTCSLPLDADEESRKRKEVQSLGREETKRKRNEGRRRDNESAQSAALRRNCSDYDGKSMEGSDISSLSNSSSVSSFPDTIQKSIRSLNSLQKDDGTLTRITGNLNRRKDTGRDMMDEMPCVSVKGDGPHGRRIEGFLYKYREGEELRIVCVCHGNFFTPGEFVKHAGGGDVSHPLRHIVVNPSPSVYY